MRWIEHDGVAVVSPGQTYEGKWTAKCRDGTSQETGVHDDDEANGSEIDAHRLCIFLPNQ